MWIRTTTTGQPWFASAVYSNAKLQDQEDDWMATEEQQRDWMSESTYIRGLFIQFHIHLTTLAGLLSTHFFQQIIPADETKPYSEKMDEAYARRRPRKLPSWFRGQQIELSIDGSFHSEWSTRTRNTGKFDREEI